MDLQQKLAAQHQEIYKDLEQFMLAITKVKNQPNNHYLLEQVESLLSYVGKLLSEHFSIEERDWFPGLPPGELITRLINDHQEIKEKYQSILSIYQQLKTLSTNDLSERDLTTTLLYPAYNLIATINHHAQREDSVIAT